MVENVGPQAQDAAREHNRGGNDEVAAAPPAFDFMGRFGDPLAAPPEGDVAEIPETLTVDDLERLQEVIRVRGERVSECGDQISAENRLDMLQGHALADTLAQMLNAQAQKILNLAAEVHAARAQVPPAAEQREDPQHAPQNPVREEN